MPHVTRNKRALPALLSLLLGCAGPGWAHQLKHGDLSIAHPFVAIDAPPCQRPVLRGYLMLVVNEGSQSDRLLGASLQGGPAGRLVKTGDGGNQALPDGVPVPAGARVALMAPEYTIEFPRPAKAPTEGGMLPGSLRFERAGVVPVQFMVEATHRSAQGLPAGCAKAAPPAHKH